MQGYTAEEEESYKLKILALMKTYEANPYPFLRYTNFAKLSRDSDMNLHTVKTFMHDLMVEKRVIKRAMLRRSDNGQNKNAPYRYVIRKNDVECQCNHCGRKYWDIHKTYCCDPCLANFKKKRIKKYNEFVA